MDCLTFLDRLAALLDGAAAPSERQCAEAHAAACVECGELLRAALRDRKQSASTPSSEGSLENVQSVAESTRRRQGPLREDLVGRVLARTTGPACRPAEELLCDYVDGQLDAGTASMLVAHLDHCPSCSALAESLRALGGVLASLAELEPGPGFLPTVLDATSRRPKRGWLAGWAAAWSGLLLSRPRLSLEAAYVGTLLFLLVFGNPAGTLQAASGRTTALAREGVGRMRSALPGALTSLSAREKEVSEATARIAVDGLGQKLSASRQAIERGTRGWWESLSARWTGAWAFARGALGWIVAELEANTSRIREAVTDLFRGRTEPAGPTSR
jgi:hypothetical protein